MHSCMCTVSLFDISHGRINWRSSGICPPPKEASLAQLEILTKLGKPQTPTQHNLSLCQFGLVSNAINFHDVGLSRKLVWSKKNPVKNLKGGILRRTWVRSLKENFRGAPRMALRERACYSFLIQKKFFFQNLASIISSIWHIVVNLFMGHPICI